ncbi:MAG: hypothetical protein AB3N23_17320 [Paracoccaceae bacterium]
MIDVFRETGWTRFPYDPAIAHWVSHALDPARASLRDPALAHWLDCEGTWFVGVDALPNDETGAVNGSGPLRGAAIDSVIAAVGPLPPLHTAQVSVTFPGYPRPRKGEGESAFRYRLNRDAAHVDGVRPEGPDRRRFVLEPHAFILGLPLNAAPADAAPLVVWEGSHVIMARAFRQAFEGYSADAWSKVDVTDHYQAARRKVFETCPRIPVPAQPGEAILLHRLCLHGVAPWAEGAKDWPDGRMVAYFRPELERGIEGWPVV